MSNPAFTEFDLQNVGDVVELVGFVGLNKKGEIIKWDKELCITKSEAVNELLDKNKQDIDVILDEIKIPECVDDEINNDGRAKETLDAVFEEKLVKQTKSFEKKNNSYPEPLNWKIVIFRLSRKDLLRILNGEAYENLLHNHKGDNSAGKNIRFS